MQQAEEDAVEATPSSCATWDSVEEMIILGLGSVGNSITSRYQLALALLLAEELPQLQSSLSVRDPVLTELDKRLLGECHVKVPALISPLSFLISISAQEWQNQGTMP